MVIQRWQSLFLLVAVVFTCLFCLTPYAVYTAPETIGNTDIFVSDAPVLLTLNIVAAVLLCADIFMFKNLKRQMTVAMVCIVLLCASIVTTCLLLYTAYPDASLIFAGGTLWLVIALFFTILARRFMAKDRRLLSSYDRLR